METHHHRAALDHATRAHSEAVAEHLRAREDYGEGCSCPSPLRTTCGGCGSSWCGQCDPAPSALCHKCHGRGRSLAPLAPTGCVEAVTLDMARAAVLAHLELCDDLGFDSRAEALHAILTHDDWATRWDCSDLPVLVEGVERYKALRLAARLAGTL